ncbi:NADPH-dependent FMN reductase [Paenibacillus thermotolerans]|uniref:NADPH-dependent FMN reductase n=1 Tax=Paenibacillus thermotolerans TaxID=3027807 RepID=UPI002367EF46|nr:MULTISPECIES: NADPH-dependent FMN reductase [unclassified Paenibacillus]
MNIVLLAGSNRKNASSTKLLRYMAKELEKKGARAVVIDLWEKPVPLYSPDGEDRLDRNAAEMIRLVQEADGIVLGTPEYHGSISGVLKNALDYMGGQQFSGKPVLSASSSGGAVGVASLTHLQDIVRNLHGINCPEWISIGGDNRRFDENGAPASDTVRTRINRALDYLLFMMERLRIRVNA